MQINLNLTYLKCFYDAALMGSISESARRNFVSQPAVSQAIMKLEKALGVPLCLHKKQHFKLTTEGEIVFQQAQEIFSAVRRLKIALDKCQEKPRMPLHFVTTNSIGLSLLPDFLPEFKLSYPDVDIHFQFGGLTQIKGWLKQGIAEFALLIQSPHVSEYQQTSLYTGKFGLYRHEKEKRSLKTIGAYVEHKEGMLVSEFQTLYSAKHGEEIPIKAELNSWEFIARCMQKSYGYGLIPDFITLHGRYPYLEPITPTLPYALCAAYPKGEELSYSADLFLQSLKAFINIS